MLATIKKFISSLLVKLKIKQYNYFLIGLFSVISLFIIVFNTQSAERTRAISNYHNLPSSLNNLNDFFETIENGSIGLNDFLAIDKNEHVLQVGKLFPCRDADRYNAQISLQGNGAVCGTLQLKLNGIYSGTNGLLENISRIELYHSYTKNKNYKVVSRYTSPNPSSNIDSILSFNVTHPGYYRALITFVGLDCRPPLNVNDYIQAQPGQYLTKEPDNPLEGGAQVLDPVIKNAQGEDVPGEICDMSGLVLQTRIAIRTRIMVQYTWYIDGVQVEQNYNGRLTLSKHIGATPGNTHKIKVTAQRDMDKQDNNCKSILPYDEIEIKITQLPDVKLYVNDAPIDQKTGQNIYYFKQGERITLKAKDSDNKDFNTHKWYLNNALQSVTSPTYTIDAPKDGDTIKVEANHTVGGNKCVGTSTIILKKAYVYSPDFSINNNGVRSSNIFSFCKEIPKGTKLTLINSGALEGGNTALDLILQEDPRATIEWFKNSTHMDKVNMTLPLSDIKNRQSPEIALTDPNDFYNIRISTTAKKVYIDTNSKAYKGVYIQTLKVEKPIIRGYQESDVVDLCSTNNNSIASTSFSITNRTTSTSVSWKLTKPDGTNKVYNQNTLSLPTNLTKGSYQLQVTASKTENGITCASDPTTITIKVHEFLNPLLAYLRPSGSAAALNSHQSYLNTAIDVYAKNSVGTNSPSEFDSNAIIKWQISNNSRTFTELTEYYNLRKINVDPTKWPPGTQKFYRYTVYADANLKCAKTTQLLRVVNSRPSIISVSGNTVGCNRSIQLKLQPTKALDSSLTLPSLLTSPNYWSYSESNNGPWSSDVEVSKGTTTYSATKTGYYKATGSMQLTVKVPGLQTYFTPFFKAYSEPIYVQIANAKPVIAYNDKNNNLTEINTTANYMANIKDLYAKNKDGTKLVDFDSSAKITWYVSDKPTTGFKPVPGSDGLKVLKIDTGKSKNTILYYRYNIDTYNGANKNCTFSSPTLIVINFHISVSVDPPGDPRSCKEPITLKMEAKDDKGIDIIDSAYHGYWYYKKLLQDEWSPSVNARSLIRYKATKTGYYRASAYPKLPAGNATKRALDEETDYSEPIYVQIDNAKPVIAYKDTNSNLTEIDTTANYMADIKDLYAKNKEDTKLVDFDSSAKITWYVSEGTPTKFAPVPGFDNNSHLIIDTVKLKDNAIYYYKYTYTRSLGSDPTSKACSKDSPVLIVANIKPTVKVAKGGSPLSCKGTAVNLVLEALDTAGKNFISLTSNLGWYYRSSSNAKWESLYVGRGQITWAATKTGYYRASAYPKLPAGNTSKRPLDEETDYSEPIYVQIDNAKPVIAYNDTNSNLTEINTTANYMADIKDLYAKNKDGTKLVDFDSSAKITWYVSEGTLTNFKAVPGSDNKSHLIIDTGQLKENAIYYYKYTYAKSSGPVATSQNTCSKDSPVLIVANIKPTVKIAKGGSPLSCKGTAVNLVLEALDTAGKSFINLGSDVEWQYRASINDQWESLHTGKGQNTRDAVKTGYYRARAYPLRTNFQSTTLNLMALDNLTHYSEPIYVTVANISPVIAYKNSTNSIVQINTDKNYMGSIKPLYARNKNGSKLDTFSTSDTITWYMSEKPTTDFQVIPGENKQELNIDTSNFKPNTIRYYRYRINRDLAGNNNCSEDSPILMVINFSFSITYDGNEAPTTGKTINLTSCNSNSITFKAEALDPQNNDILDSDALSWLYRETERLSWSTPTVTALRFRVFKPGYYSISVKSLVSKNIVGQKQPLSIETKNARFYLSVQKYNTFIAYKNSNGVITDINTDSNYMAALKDLYARYKNDSTMLAFGNNTRITWYMSDNPTTGFAPISGANQPILKIDTNGFKKNTIRYYKYGLEINLEDGKHKCNIESPVLTVINFQISVKPDNNNGSAVSCDGNPVTLKMEALNDKGEDIINPKLDVFWYYRTTQNGSWIRTIKGIGRVKAIVSRTAYYRASAYPIYPGTKPKTPLEDETDYSEPIYVLIEPTVKPRIKPNHSLGVCKNSPVILSALDNNNTPYASKFNYQWYKGTQAITGATKSTYQTDTTGLYKVEVINSTTNCRNTSDAYTVTEVVLDANFKIQHPGQEDTHQYLVTKNTGPVITATLAHPQPDTNRYKWKVEYLGSQKELPVKYIGSPQSISVTKIQGIFGNKSGHYILQLTDSLYNCIEEKRHDFYLVYKEPVTYKVTKEIYKTNQKNQSSNTEELTLTPTNNLYTVCKGDTLNLKTGIYKFYNDDNNTNTKFKLKYVLYKDNQIASTTISNEEPEIKISGSGSYRLEVIVLKPIDGNDSIGSHLDPVTFTVREEDSNDINAQFDVSNNLCINSDNKVKLTAKQTNNRYYQWYEVINGDTVVIGNDSEAGSGHELEVKLAPGRHTIELVTTNANYCSDRLKKTIDITEKPEVVLKSSKNTICENGNSLLTVTKRSKVTISTYKWEKYDESGKQWVLLQENNKDSLNVSDGGKYRVLVTNADNCTSPSNEIKVEKSVIEGTIQVAPADTNCIPANQQTALTAAITSGTIKQYEWFQSGKTIGTTKTISRALASGPNTITLKLTDSLGCVKTIDRTINITHSSTPEIQVLGEKYICNDVPVKLRITPAISPAIGYKSYKWQTEKSGTWTDIANQTSADLNVSDRGKYRVMVTNADNCPSPSNAITVEKQTLTAEFTPNEDTYCFDTGTHKISLKSSQIDANYIWTIVTPTNTITHNTQNVDIDIQTSGIYKITLLVTKNGCSQSKEKQIAVVIKPNITYTKHKSILCLEATDSIEVEAKTTYSINLPLQYKWYKGTTLLAANPVANKITITEPGTYHVEVDLMNPLNKKQTICSVVGRDITITRSTINAEMDITGTECIDPDTNDPIKITAKYSVATDYKWTIKDSTQKTIKTTTSTTSEFSLNPSELKEGEYTVNLKVSDSLCTTEKTQTFTISKKPKAIIMSNVTNNVICNDSPVKLTVTLDNAADAAGEFTYAWYRQVNNAWQKIETNANTSVYETKQAGLYKAEVKSSYGCITETKGIEVIKSTVNARFTMDPENTLCIDNDQKFVLTAEDTTEGNTYEWRNVLNGKKYQGRSITVGHEVIIHNLLIIRLTVTNKYGCKASYDETSKVITYSSHPHIQVQGDTREICIVEGGMDTEVKRTPITLTAMSTDSQEVKYKSYRWQKQRLPMWFWDDIQGATNKDYQATQAGNYRVLAMNEDNCEGESEAVTITENRVSSGFNNSIKPNENDPKNGYTLLCINKGASVLFTANDKDATKYTWSYKTSPTGNQRQFPTNRPGDNAAFESGMDSLQQTYLEVSLSLEKNQCKSDITTHRYYVVYKPKVSIVKTNNKSILCSAEDSIVLAAHIQDPLPNSIKDVKTLYKWYKKTSGTNTLIGTDETINVKEPGDYFVEVTYQLTGNTVQTCAGASETVKIGQININADHNYTNTNEIQCLDTDTIVLDAKYKSATAQYNWTITDLATQAQETSKSAQFSYKVQDEGNYKIALQVKDAQLCTETSEHVLNISIKPPSVSIHKDPDKTNFCSYEVMNLQARPSKDFKNLQYEWQYSADNNQSSKWEKLETSAKDTHKALKTGYYKVILHSALGCQSESEPIYVNKSEITIDPSIDIEKCPNILQELVIHNTTNYNDIVPRTCTWDFGDGTSELSSCDTVVHHKYATPGSYDLKLTITAQDGCVFTKTFNIEYKGDTRPNSKIEVENKKSNYCQLDTIILKDVSLYKSPDRYSAKWKVEANGQDITGDVIKATDAETITIQPLRSISTDVEYKVTLTSTNTAGGANCQDDTSTTLQIIAQPELDFDEIPSEICKDHDPIVFKGHYKYSGKNNVKEIYEYEKVGSGKRTLISGNQLPIKDLVAGAYNIYYRVEVSNNSGANVPICKEELKHKITIHDYELPVIQVQGDGKGEVCEGKSITLTVTKDFDNYQWYKDGQPIAHAVNKIFQAEQTGSYYVVTNYQYCGTKQSNQVSVKVFGAPIAKFTFPDQLECKDEKIKFINNSTSQSPIVKYEWDFGDGGISTEENPEHAYQEIGDYDVTLKVTNQDGCSALIKQNFSYRKIKPKIEFTPITACIVDPVEAKATVHLVTGNVGTMEWTLYADGNPIEHQTYSKSDQKFKYIIPKQYANSKLELELKVTTDEGCVVIDRLPVVLKPLPNVNIGFKQMRVCSQAHYINLKENATPAVGGTWYLIKPGLSEAEKEVIDNGLLDVSQLIPGVYKIRLEYKNNATSCSNVDEAEIIIEPEPHGEIIAITKDNREIKGDTRSNTVDLCDSDGLKLRVKVSNGTLKQLYTYTWYKDSVPIKNSTSDSIDVHEPGTYEVHIAMNNRSGCATETKLKINISSNYRVVIDPKPIELCKSSKPIMLSFGSITPASSESVGTQAYYVLRDGKKSEPIVMFDPSKYSGDVEVLYEFVSFNGCKDSKSKIIKVVTLDGSVEETLEVKEGDSAVIKNDVHSDNGATLTYKWMPNTYLSSDDVAEPTVTPQRDIVYNLEIRNGSDCVYNYKVKVVVIPNLHVPNVILPNSSSASNSVLHISGIEKYPNAIITIVNRFGQKVWESEPGYPTPWDGMDQNGQPLEIGTYYYILKMNNQSSAFQQDATDATSEKRVEDLTGYIEIIY